MKNYMAILPWISSAVSVDFILSFPVQLVKDLNHFLEVSKLVGPSEMSDFVFEPIWETFVVLS